MSDFYLKPHTSSLALVVIRTQLFNLHFVRRECIIQVCHDTFQVMHCGTREIKRSLTHSHSSDHWTLIIQEASNSIASVCFSSG